MHLQIFRQSVSAASCKPSTYAEHTLHTGLGCGRSYKVLGQWGKQWIGCLPSAPEGDGISFWQSCPSSCRYWSMWACIIAQVLLVLALLVWLWLSADPNCCSFSDRNLNRFSARVVDAGVDGVAVDDDAGVTGVWWMFHEKTKSRD